MRITYFNDNIRIVIDDENFENVKYMIKFLLDHPLSKSQVEPVEEPVEPIEQIPEPVEPEEPEEPVEPIIPVPLEIPVPLDHIKIPEPSPSETGPAPLCETPEGPIAPKNQDDYYRLLDTIKISSPKECRGKYFSLIDYFKFWDDEKQVSEFITNLENNRDLQLIIKNPANHIRWICHIIHSITAYYNFFDAKFILEKREHYHRLRSGWNLKKADSKSVE
jgi:hypothetical protein